MLDLNHLPTNQKVDRQIFTANTTINQNLSNAVTWTKPRGVNFIRILCLGGGGGGGAGGRGAVNVSSGGGGGGSSSQSIINFPVWFLPDILYVVVGYGGAGGAIDTNGSAGISSYVLINSNNLVGANVLCSGIRGSGGLSAGGAGAGGTTLTIGNIFPSIMGQAYSTLVTNRGISGQAGATGGSSGGNGTSLPLQTTGLIVMGGCGGGAYAGAINSAGGAGGTIRPNVDPYPNQPTAAGGTSAGTAGEKGSNGVQAMPNLPFFYGGAGGGGAGQAATGNSSLNGGSGGKGAYGCGGGGGGGGFTGCTGNTGGDGGDGLVIITSW